MSVRFLRFYASFWRNYSKLRIYKEKIIAYKSEVAINFLFPAIESALEACTGLITAADDQNQEMNRLLEQVKKQLADQQT